MSAHADASWDHTPRGYTVRRTLEGANYFTAEQRRDSLADLERLEDYADSLFGELEAEKHVHRKDNAYLLGELRRLRDIEVKARAFIRTTSYYVQRRASRPEFEALAFALLDGTPSATQTLEDVQPTGAAE
jgi:hypothetical protein